MKEYIDYLQGLLREHNIPFKAQVEQQQLGEFGYDHINRYKRQMILPEISYQGQINIHKAKVLIVGAGGIGAPAALYLAGAGVGTIGLIDGDKVEMSNLHRQIIHTTERIGMNKCESAREQILQFNPMVQVNVHPFNLDSQNANQVFSQYDVILDASDNPATRYLVNDAAIYQKKPLVSGSAVGWEGQITVYGYDGPCYRCLFPECPKSYTNCSDSGVFGVMPGFIGLIEALETIKIILKLPSLSQKMVLIDGLRGSYKTVKLRGKQQNCKACGDNAQIIVEQFDYQGFANMSCSQPVPFRGGYKEIEWPEFLQLPKDNKQRLLIDVRPEAQFKILKFDGFVNVPYSEIDSLKLNDPDQEVYIMCRRGNNSRLACEILVKQQPNIFNIVGGIESYAKQFDPLMPSL